MEERKPTCTIDRIANWCRHYTKIVRVLKKIKIELPYNVTIPHLGIYPKKSKILIWTGICTTAHCSSTDDNQDAETT